MEVCILEGSRIERRGFKTDAKGRQLLTQMLRKTDTVGMEYCCCAATLTREILAEVGCWVHDLNAGALRIIWKSQKKTDKEDALKLAKYVRDTPEDSMVDVELPSEEEEAFRADISMKEFLKKERTAAINRLHSLYARLGITDVTKKDLQDASGRKGRRAELPAWMQAQSIIFEQQLELFERQIAEAAEKVEEKTRKHELAPYVLSIPGVGLGIASVFLAYLGDGSRFENAGQVASYAGLVPSVDSSGERERYGGISRTTYCRPIRSVVLEGVWTLVRTRVGTGDALAGKWESLSCRMSRRKSAVAVARKLVCLAWLLMRRREYYKGTTDFALQCKLKKYKVKPEGGDALACKIAG
jgi:transposase